jgi:glycosidase
MFKKIVLVVATALLLLPHSAKAVNEVSPNVGLTKDLIYFVFPDRYRNGDTTNDLAGGTNSDPTNGFNPTSTAHFHGGDLKGLTGTCSPGDNGLQRIKSLGFTAVWLTPLVTQTMGTDNGAGYHGYWGSDFLNVDPHLGSNEDLIAFTNCAKKLNLKVILDVVTNHTGDVISYSGTTPYVPAQLVGSKNPAWLNDLNNYHNAGNIGSCFIAGDCETIGDFYGLDDLATEKAEVVKGWIDVYGAWIKKYGISGFRVDTARHLDENFFKNWSPGIEAAAKTVGIDKFTIFGEFYDSNPLKLVSYVRDLKIQTALDFGFQRSATEFASGLSDSRTLDSLFSFDDQYTSPISSASNLVTFLGNHDMGRVGLIIPGLYFDDNKNYLPRIKLAHALMYLSRGIPTVYYGDEVGMTGTGDGKDQLARQDMFETKIPAWKKESRIGSAAIGNGNSFTVTAAHPIALYLKKLSALRAQYPTLANGAMQIRQSTGNSFVFSKYDPVEKIEYLVALNNSKNSIRVSIPTSTVSQWKVIFGDSKVNVKKEIVTLTIPPLDTVVLKSSKVMTATPVKVGKLLSKLDLLSGMTEVSAPLKSTGLNRVEFSVRESGSSNWVNVGVDFNAPYRVYLSPKDFRAGVKLTVKATAISIKGDRYDFKEIETSN